MFWCLLRKESTPSRLSSISKLNQFHLLTVDPLVSREVSCALKSPPRIQRGYLSNSFLSSGSISRRLGDCAHTEARRIGG